MTCTTQPCPIFEEDTPVNILQNVASAWHKQHHICTFDLSFKCICFFRVIGQSSPLVEREPSVERRTPRAVGHKLMAQSGQGGPTFVWGYLLSRKSTIMISTASYHDIPRYSIYIICFLTTGRSGARGPVRGVHCAHLRAERRDEDGGEGSEKREK